MAQYIVPDGKGGYVNVEAQSRPAGAYTPTEFYKNPSTQTITDFFNKAKGQQKPVIEKVLPASKPFANLGNLSGGSPVVGSGATSSVNSLLGQVVDNVSKLAKKATPASRLAGGAATAGASFVLGELVDWAANGASDFVISGLEAIGVKAKPEPYAATKYDPVPDNNWRVPEGDIPGKSVPPSDVSPSTGKPIPNSGGSSSGGSSSGGSPSSDLYDPTTLIGSLNWNGLQLQEQLRSGFELLSQSILSVPAVDEAISAKKSELAQSASSSGSQSSGGVDPNIWNSDQSVAGTWVHGGFNKQMIENMSSVAFPVNAPSNTSQPFSASASDLKNTSTNEEISRVIAALQAKNLELSNKLLEYQITPRDVTLVDGEPVVKISPMEAEHLSNAQNMKHKSDINNEKFEDDDFDLTSLIMPMLSFKGVSSELDAIHGLFDTGLSTNPFNMNFDIFASYSDTKETI